MGLNKTKKWTLFFYGQIMVHYNANDIQKYLSHFGPFWITMLGSNIFINIWKIFILLLKNKSSTSANHIDMYTLCKITGLNVKI